MPKDAWLKEVLNLEQLILDGKMLSMDQLLAVPEEIRLKSPLLLRAECEDGLLGGRLAETQLLLETALKGFAAQADEASMLAMMGMLGLLYEQAGDRQESQTFMGLLRQEWRRSPENCSGFVPWALAREEANAGSSPDQSPAASDELFLSAAERFREESRPMWAGFVLLDWLLFDPQSVSEPQWQLWLHWLSRNLTEERYGGALQEVLKTKRASVRLCSRLPGRYAYLCKAVLFEAADEKPPAVLVGDIEIQIYALGAKIKRLLAEGDAGGAASALDVQQRLQRLVSTPATRRLAAALREAVLSAGKQGEAGNKSPAPAAGFTSDADDGEILNRTYGSSAEQAEAFAERPDAGPADRHSAGQEQVEFASEAPDAVGDAGRSLAANGEEVRQADDGLSERSNGEADGNAAGGASQPPTGGAIRESAGGAGSRILDPMPQEEAGRPDIRTSDNGAVGSFDECYSGDGFRQESGSAEPGTAASTSGNSRDRQPEPSSSTESPAGEDAWRLSPPRLGDGSAAPSHPRQPAEIASNRHDDAVEESIAAGHDHTPSSGSGITGADGAQSPEAGWQTGPEATPACWRIRLFDGIRFSLANGADVQPVWKRRKAGELLAYLLLQPGYKANRNLVIERVFGEGDLAKRSNQLYVTLHDLRQSMKDAGMTDDPVYAKSGVIAVDEHTVDYVDAEAYLTLSRVGDQLWMDDREAACRLYEKALPLYGHLGRELPHSEWLDRMREQMLDRQTNMLKRTSLYYSDHHDDARAEQYIGEWIALRPQQEEAYETMIRHCLGKGGRAEAIGWYRRLERMCQEELGTEPIEEIRGLLWK